MAYSAVYAPQTNGTMAMPAGDDDAKLLSELAAFRDAVIAGKHPQFVLPPAVIEQLKATLTPPAVEQSQSNGPYNGAAVSGSTTNAPESNLVPTNPFVPKEPAAFPSAQPQYGQQQFSLPGLFTGPPGPAASTGHLSHATAGVVPNATFTTSGKVEDPVRAENRLKRQRIEREMQMSSAQGKTTRMPAGETSDMLDVEAVLARTLARETHVSGLKPAVARQTGAASEQSSFDENDYYSSQVESEWSSPVSASKVSDHAAAASTFPQQHEAAASLGQPRADAHNDRSQPITSVSHAYSGQPGPVINLDDEDGDGDDEDDEYTPPDASQFNGHGEEVDDVTLHDAADDSSEYEPGEISPESNGNSPFASHQQPAQASPHVPVIRNHLTHIAAPQPNRVSPLAVTKMPSVGELQLVNGRPEFVQTHPAKRPAIDSNASEDSLDGMTGGSSKKNKNKKAKRKREQENNVAANGNSKRSKKQKKLDMKKARELRRQSGNDAHSPSPVLQQAQPYIKNEPASPPSHLHRVPEAGGYPVGLVQQTPGYVDLVSPRRAGDVQYVSEAPRYAVRPEYRLASPANIGGPSPVSYRPVQRDTQDLRRVASLHYAQRPASPGAQPYASTGRPQYRTVSMPQSGRVSRAASGYESEMRYLPEEPSRSPLPPPEYREVYQPMPPPRQIFVDQYGNQYYAEPAPSRASVAPVDRHATAAAIDPSYERAPSRMSVAYASRAPEPADSRMAPPPLPGRSHVQYVDEHGYPVPQHSTRHPGAEREVQYIAGVRPMSVYQPASYDPQAYRDAREEQTSPVYAAPPPPLRSYSVRPAEDYPMPRSGSVAPVQYLRAAEPSSSRHSLAPAARAVSVMPGYDPAAPVTYVRKEMAPPPPPVPLPPSSATGGRAVSVVPGYDPAQPELVASSAAPPRGYHPQERYSMAPPPPAAQQPIRYVDQHGVEVFPQPQAPPPPRYQY